MKNQKTSSAQFKRLDPAVLKPGDIVLATTGAALSAAIRVATWSDVSHAMIYVQDHSIIDATDEGVHAKNTQRLLLETDKPVYVLRLKTGLSGEQLAAVVSYARGHVGTRYSKGEAVRTVFGGSDRSTRQQFCSRFVAQAFASAGIRLVADPNYCSPDDIKASDLLETLDDATLAVSAQELAWWDGTVDLPQLMRDATNMVLERARKFDPAIETFDDIHAHLAAHPEHDNALCETLQQSGYLSLWQLERAKNPWHYDAALMGEMPASDSEGYCLDVLADEAAGANRFIVNRAGYSTFARGYPLRFFALMLELYDRLAQLYHERVSTATDWLTARALIPAGHPTEVLVPHSAAWFDALERWDPGQAAMTRIAIAAAGSSEVCSVCADNPAADYRLHKGQRPPAGVDTIRLCNDCLHIRTADGEHYLAL